MEKSMTKTDMFPFSTPTGNVQENVTTTSHAQMPSHPFNDFELVPSTPEPKAEGAVNELHFF